MKIIKILFLLVTTNLLSQSFGQNENLKRYKSIEHINFSGHKKSGWKTEYKLSNGKIIQRENYYKNQLRQRVIYIHDSILKIVTEVEKYNSNEGNVSDTIKYIYKWNRANQLVEKEDMAGGVEKYSNFNYQSLPGIIERFGSPLDSVIGFKEEYIYDSNRNIINEKRYTKIDNKIEVEINDYKYDKYNNIIEIDRKSIPKQSYPIPVAGGLDLYENEKYRYVYNDFGLWIEQYRIVENKEFLIGKRKFK